MKYLLLECSVQLLKKTILANLVSENELWMGIQFWENYFGLEIVINFIRLQSMNGKWIEGDQDERGQENGENWKKVTPKLL